MTALVQASDLDPRRDVYSSEAAAAGIYPGSRGCRIRWLDDQPDHLELECAQDSAAFVVIADDWFPGWSATLDGRPWPLHPVQHLLRGAALPAGTHRLRLAFQPEGWRAGVMASRSAWSLWLLLGFLALALRRAAPPTQPEDRASHPQPVGGETRQRPQRR